MFDWLFGGGKTKAPKARHVIGVKQGKRGRFYLRLRDADTGHERLVTAFQGNNPGFATRDEALRIAETIAAGGIDVEY